MTMFKRARWDMSEIFWALVLITLPVTSFRFFPFFGSGTVVRPLSLYPLIGLLAVLAWRMLRGELKLQLPTNSALLGVFLMVILLTGAIGVLISPPEGVGMSYIGRAMRALLTVFIGLAFYFAAFSMNRSTESLKRSVLWLFVGLAITFVWGCIQFYGLNHGTRGELLKIQNLFSVRGLVKNKRVSGFAYEPSWLASQLTTLYFPWIYAALFTGLPLVSLKWRFPKLEHLIPLFINLFFLLAAVTLLLFTYSRSGLAIAFASTLATFAITGRQALKRVGRWFFKPNGKHRWLDLLTRAGMICVVVIGVAGVWAFLSDKGYISAFFQKNTENIFDYLQKAYLGPRFAYLFAALGAYVEHPFTGGGLGASGFWVLKNMPDWALSGNLEIARLLSPSTNIFPNPKNLFVRVLAETGIFGFALLALYYLTLFGMALYLFRSGQAEDGDRWALFVGSAGMFGVTAVILSGFSQDSFAMPELWITPGLLAGYFQATKINERGREV